MPKKVDHDERRDQIAAAVSRLAARRGLDGVSFREVAAEAQMSVSLVQHYFGSKDGLMVGTLDIESARFAQHIGAKLEAAGADASPIEQVSAVVGAFIPTDEPSRAAMLLYHGFAAAALTDPALRRADAFTNEANLRSFISTKLTEARNAGAIDDDANPELEARGLISIALGLSLGVLLERVLPDEAEQVLAAHIARLARRV